MKKLIFLFFTFLSISCFGKQDAELIIPAAPGGISDVAARVLLKHINDENFKFVLDYKPGAGTLLAINHTASNKNGTSILIITNSIATLPFLPDTSASYDLVRDFILVDYIGSEPLIILTKNDGKINSFTELINRSTVEFLPYGTAGFGTTQHTIMSLIANKNSNFVNVPYKGESHVLTALLTGEIKFSALSIPISKSLIAEEKLKPLAVFSNNRLKEYPNIPTIKELGINDRQFQRYLILVANKNADQKIINHIRTKMNNQDLKKELINLGFDITKPNLNNFFLNELSKMKNIIKDYN